MTKIKFVKLGAQLLAIRGDAIKFRVLGEEEPIWVPRSLLSFRCDQSLESLQKSSDFELELPKWKAQELGLEGRE